MDLSQRQGPCIVQTVDIYSYKFDISSPRIVEIFRWEEQFVSERIIFEDVVDDDLVFLSPVIESLPII